MEAFFKSHAFLIEHTNIAMHRALMDEIDWKHRMIGIKGPRGVGKTTFLLQYAKDYFDVNMRQCLYINMNSFYFQGRGLVDFAEDFIKHGGRVLLIDQVFKQPEWSKELCECYRRFSLLRIVYATSSVEGTDDSGDELNKISKCYILHGFSFREFINLQTGNRIAPVSLNDILNHSEQLQKSILPKVRPWNYFQDYLHHGYYPFFLESRNFTENLLKAINMMIEVDILFIKQIDLKYLARLKKLLYLLAINGSDSPNVSRLAAEIGTSRATVMNYMKNLEEARLIHQIYKCGDENSKKPSKIMLHNTNLMYAIQSSLPTEQEVMETFFTNSMWRHHKVEKGKKNASYIIDGNTEYHVCEKAKKVRQDNEIICARYNTEIGRGSKDIPLWLFGFLY
ncbi:MAG: AAA family ATPase [Bacteroidaceae bacterium]